MNYEITVYPPKSESPEKNIVLSDNNWFSAWQKGARQLNLELDMNQVMMNVLPDGQSADITDPKTGTRITIRQTSAPASPVEAPKPTPEQQAQAAKDVHYSSVDSMVFAKPSFLPPETKSNAPKSKRPAPVAQEQRTTDEQSAPILSESSFSIHGKYQQGLTEAFLMDAFMKVANLYDDFADDKEKAMDYILDMVLKGLNTSVAAILLTDLNDPSGQLWFERVTGHKADELQNVRISIERGPIGLSAQTGVVQNIENIHKDERFQGDVLQEDGMDLGPIVCVPLQHKEQTHGVLMLGKVQGRSPYKSGEVNILNYIGNALGEYLYHLNNATPPAS